MRMISNSILDIIVMLVGPPTIIIGLYYRRIVESEWFLLFFQIKLKTRVCGCQTRLKGRIKAHGKSFNKILELREGKVAYCHTCLSKMAIKCAWCEEVVLHEERDRLYQAMTDDYLLPRNINMIFHDPNYLLGCNTKKCPGPMVAKHFGFDLIKEGHRHHALKDQILYQRIKRKNDSS